MPIPTRRPLLLAGLALMAGLLAGCASAPPKGEPPPAEAEGTVTTFHRKSSGSLGNFDGQVVWTTGRSTWKGKPVVSVQSPTAGTSLHDPVTHGLVANLGPAGQPVFSFDPPLAWNWPLEVGKSWSSRHAMTVHASNQTLPLDIQWKVEAYESVTVPAGTFMAFRIVSRNNYGETETRWTSPKDRIATIKRTVVRAANAPQGAGQLEAVLLSNVRPAR